MKFLFFLILDTREDYEIYLCNIYDVRYTNYYDKSIINKKIILKKGGKKIVRNIGEKFHS